MMTRICTTTLAVCLSLAGGQLACSSDSEQQQPGPVASGGAADGGGGPVSGAAGDGAQAEGGAGGAAGSSVAPCVPGEHAAQAEVSVPSPLVSLELPVATSDAVTNAEGLVDGRYGSGSSTACSFGLPTPEEPAWAALQVGPGPNRLLVAWQDPGVRAYDVLTGGAPADYRIETSDDSTDGSDGNWNVVVEVTGNPVRARVHSFDFTDMSWVRFVVTAAPEDSSAVLLDELAIHDLSESGDDLPQDGWLFMGDSITQAAFARNRNAALVFANIVHDNHPAFDPIMINAGVGGDLSDDGVDDVDQWLAFNPDLLHVAIAYGTNDSWGGHSPASTGFEANLRTMVEAVLDDGRVPMLVRIPYASEAHPTVAEFNEIVDALQQEYGLACAPDLYSWFLEHPDELSNDGVHPSPAGYGSINQRWAEAVDPLYTDP
jgi:acyl-CoA thioesterase-1